MTKDTTLLKAAINASNTINGIYQWVDMIEAEGGAGTISGVAKCHAFLTSMKKNRSRLDSLVMSPLAEEIRIQKGETDARLKELKAARDVAAYDVQAAAVAAIDAAYAARDAGDDASYEVAVAVAHAAYKAARADARAADAAYEAELKKIQTENSND